MRGVHPLVGRMVSLGALCLALLLVVVSVVVGHEHSVPHGGDYPYPPGVLAPVAGFTFPRVSAGGINCGALVSAWVAANIAPTSNSMHGVMLVQPPGGALTGYYTVSGTADAVASVAGPAAAGAPAAWTRVLYGGLTSVGGNLVRRHSQAFKLAYADPMASFANPRAMCRNRPNTNNFDCTFPDTSVRPGEPIGICALAKLGLYLRDVLHLAPANVVCAAEATRNGWLNVDINGRTGQHALPRADYVASEVVSSCVTCQNQIPFMFGYAPQRASCATPVAPPAVAGNRGNCPDPALAGEAGRLARGATCQFACNPGYDHTGPAMQCRRDGSGLSPRQTCVRRAAWNPSTKVPPAPFVPALQPNRARVQPAVRGGAVIRGAGQPARPPWNPSTRILKFKSRSTARP